MKGFSLLELMLTCSIVTILMAVSLPMYQSFTQNADRQLAKARVYEIASALESKLTQDQTYAGLKASDLGIADTKQYALEIAKADSSHYLISANPLKHADPACGSFSLDESGFTQNTASKTLCW